MLCGQLSTAPDLSASLLHLFAEAASANAQPFCQHTAELERAAQQQPALVPQVARVLAATGCLSQVRSVNDCCSIFVAIHRAKLMSLFHRYFR